MDLDCSDVANFPTVLSTAIRKSIIRIGPTQIQMEFPKTNGRSYSSFHYTKKEANGETTKREWLVYSKSLDAAHCFCCVLFSKTLSFGSNRGFSDWQHLSENIKTHESSATHKSSYAQWIGMRRAILTDKTGYAIE